MWAKSGRGMALQFQLPKGLLHHITMLNTPMFGAANFLELALIERIKQAPVRWDMMVSIG